MSRVRVGVPIPIGYNMHYSLHFTGIRVYKTEAIFGVALLQSMVRRNSIYLYPFYDIDRFIYRSEVRPQPRTYTSFEWVLRNTTVCWRQRALPQSDLLT